MYYKEIQTVLCFSYLDDYYSIQKRKKVVYMTKICYYIAENKNVIICNKM